MGRGLSWVPNVSSTKQRTDQGSEPGCILQRGRRNPQPVSGSSRLGWGGKVDSRALPRYSLAGGPCWSAVEGSVEAQQCLREQQDFGGLSFESPGLPSSGSPNTLLTSEVLLDMNLTVPQDAIGCNDVLSSIPPEWIGPLQRKPCRGPCLSHVELGTESLGSPHQKTREEGPCLSTRGRH